MGFLDSVLDAAYNVDELEKQTGEKRPVQNRNIPRQQMNQRGSMMVASTPDEIDNLMNDLEDSIHGPSVQTPKGQEYDPQADLERLQKIQENGGAVPKEYIQRSNMPRAIVESIMANPCNLDPSLVMESDPRRAELDNMLMAKFGNGSETPSNAFERVHEINDLLDEADAKNEPQQSVQTRSVNENSISNVDYSLIKTIVSAVLDEKLDVIKKALLTESTRPMPNLSNIKAVSMKDKVLFVDSDNNVYECSFTYKGKNKKSK